MAFSNNSHDLRESSQVRSRNTVSSDNILSPERHTPREFRSRIQRATTVDEKQSILSDRVLQLCRDWRRLWEEAAQSGIPVNRGRLLSAGLKMNDVVFKHICADAYLRLMRDGNVVHNPETIMLFDQHPVWRKNTLIHLLQPEVYYFTIHALPFGMFKALQLQWKNVPQAHRCLELKFTQFLDDLPFAHLPAWWFSSLEDDDNNAIGGGEGLPADGNNDVRVPVPHEGKYSPKARLCKEGTQILRPLAWSGLRMNLHEWKVFIEVSKFINTSIMEATEDNGDLFALLRHNFRADNDLTMNRDYLKKYYYIKQGWKIQLAENQADVPEELLQQSPIQIILLRVSSLYKEYFKL